MFGSLGFTELILILFIVLIIFGAGKLPQLGEGIGKAIKGFKKSVHEADMIEAEAQAQAQQAEPVQAQAIQAQPAVPMPTPQAEQPVAAVNSTRARVNFSTQRAQHRTDLVSYGNRCSVGDRIHRDLRRKRQGTEHR